MGVLEGQASAKSGSSLDESLKETIQDAYRRTLEGMGFRARRSQRLMIAAIANCIGSEEEERLEGGRVCLVEAGTGTGKTLAYAIAALPVARYQRKKLILATATVALQEQLYYKDLPAFQRHSGLDFSFALAKGRRRYLCLVRFEAALGAGDQGTLDLALGGDPWNAVSHDQLALYQAMTKALVSGEWQGDRDAWPDALEDDAWLPVTSDHAQCTGSKCSHYRGCFYYRARERMYRADCIVANQDLVLSDLIQADGSILPAPEDAIYVFDEGHHLPEKAIQHHALSLGLRSTEEWLRRLPEQLEAVVELVGRPTLRPLGEAQLDRLIDDAASACDRLRGMLADGFAGGGESTPVMEHRFPFGEIPPAVRALSLELRSPLRELHARFDGLLAGIADMLADGDDLEHVEDAYGAAATMVARLDAANRLVDDYGDVESSAEGDEMPSARWLQFAGGDPRTEGAARGGSIAEIRLHTSPIRADPILQMHLWDRSFGAVVTSATLAAGGNFDRFSMQAGVPANCPKIALPSPFDLRRQGRIHVPSAHCDPRDVDEHTRQLVEGLPLLLAAAKGSMVLFASWKQMNQVAAGIDPAFRERLLVQGETSKNEILVKHRSRIAAGSPSTVFGLASFAEGIDLPGEDCTHLVIAKIPFAVPDDPVLATLNEWLARQGRNAFEEIAIPDAILRLTQACGRLIRTADDEGTITIFDGRLLSQRYGRRILDALPPFTRVVGPLA